MQHNGKDSKWCSHRKKKRSNITFFSPDVLYFYTNILRQEKFRTKNLRAKLLMHMHINYFLNICVRSCYHLQLKYDKETCNKPMGCDTFLLLQYNWVKMEETNWIESLKKFRRLSQLPTHSQTTYRCLLKLSFFFKSDFPKW